MDQLKMIYRLAEDIYLQESNPRKNDEAVEKVRESIRAFGFRVPIVTDDEGRIWAGETRYKAGLLEGMTEFPCTPASGLSEDALRAFRLADNKVAEFAEWDEEKLLAELDAITMDMSTFGFDLSAFDIEADVQEDEFNCEPPVVPTTKRGEVYSLGRHRLMCGDSTRQEDVGRLMNGELANLLLTDPPYNVDYEGATSDHLKIENDHMAPDEYRTFLASAFTAADAAMRPGAAFYLWHADTGRLLVQSACEAAGWRVRQCLIWRKNHFAFGRQDYHWQHEPSLYGWKDGGPHYFVDDRTQSTILDEDKPLASQLHPTMKPVPLMARLIQNSSRKGERVLDLFGGAGSTLISAEQLGRICYIMEYDPRYADVIINRWEDLTQEKAVRIE